MFATGTHAREWTFKNEAELSKLREKANENYITQFKKTSNSSSVPEFLTLAEERILYRYFEFTLNEFCKKFKPVMPKTVTSCSLHFYKRFYINNSVMNYHPKHIIVTCVFLACKVEEFNVSMMQFVSNLKGDRAKAVEIILSHELLLMDHLKYQLTVHHPYRPMRGLLLDIKTRCPNISDLSKLQPVIDDLLERIYMTDALLLYAPSQIALAAIVLSAKGFRDNLVNGYVANFLAADSEKNLAVLKDAIANIYVMLKKIEVVTRDQLKPIEQKLEKCRNEENNPGLQEEA